MDRGRDPLLSTSVAQWRPSTSRGTGWYFRKWRKDGTWEQVEEAMVRESEGRDATPSGAIDSQSVKTTEKGGLTAMTQAKRCRDASATS